MIKGFSMKKLLACALVVLNLVTFLPIAASAAADDPVIYDAYISGNFTGGQVLKANYSFAANSGLDVDETNKTIVWHALNRAGSDNGYKMLDNTGTDTYTLSSTAYNDIGNDFSIFFTLTPKDSQGNDIGKMAYSHLGTEALNPAEAGTAENPYALNAVIIPQNLEGTTNIGDTLVVRYVYRELAGAAEDGTTFKWFRASKLEETPVEIEGETSQTYTVKPEDFGKWIFAEVTPSTVNGNKGTAVTTYNHIGNPMLSSGASAKTDKFRAVQSYYSVAKILAENSAVAKPNSDRLASGVLVVRYAQDEATITADAGETVPFDGVYFKTGSGYGGKTIPNLVISYSNDGEDWSNVMLNELSVSPGVYEHYFDTVRYARYFKMSLKATADGDTKTQVQGDTDINDFFPFVTDAVLPELTLSGDEEMYMMIGDMYTEPGYSATDSSGNDISADVVVDGTVNTSQIGIYPITYSITASGLPTVTKTRTVYVDTGIKTPGDLAYKAPVTSVNAVNNANLTDGNPYTLWEASEINASAVIDLGEVMGLSRFVMAEEGANISSYTISVSKDRSSWQTVHIGAEMGEADITVDPVYARYVKLEIAEASANAKIKGFEIHISEEDKVELAAEGIDIGSDLDNVYQNLTLPLSGDYGTTIDWESSHPEIIAADGTVTRAAEKTIVTLTATVYTENATTTRDFKVTVAQDSVPKAIDVYVTGNYVEGETLTAHYTYYDEAGIPEDTEGVRYQWYRATNFSSSDGSGAISGATEKTYTLTEADRIFTTKNDAGVETKTAKDYNIYVTVTPKSVAGATGSEMSSAYGTTVQTVSTVDIPVIHNAYITSASPTGTMVAGDTLAAHYSYQERGLTPEGKTTFMWQVKDGVDGNAKIRKAESTNNTYTLTEDDFGKIIECVITPKTADGLAGKSVTARNHYGNAFISGIKSYSNVAAEISASSLYYRRGTPAQQLLCYADAGYHMTYGGSTETTSTFSYDMGEEKAFDTIYMKVASSSYTALTIKISSDGTNYTPLELSKNYVSAGATETIKLDSVKKARYIHVSGRRKGYLQLWAFYPYLSVNAKSTITVDSETEEIRQYENFVDDSFTALNPFGEDATGDVVVSGSVNTDVLGSYEVTYTLDVPGYPSVTAAKTFTVVAGIPTEGDVAYKKTVAAGLTKLVDGNPNTSWTGSGTENEIVIDFGTETGFSKVVLGENGSNVTGFSVLYSDNGSNWTAAKGFVQTDSLNAEFAPAKARYIKIVVKSDAAPTLHSAEVFVTDTAKVKLAAENLELDGNLSSLTEDLALPTCGDYDVAITWESSNPDVIGEEGAITRTSKDEDVTLTATISNDALTLTKTFYVTVAKKEGGSSSGGGGGGGGGGSSGGSSGFFSTPNVVQAPEPIQSNSADTKEPYTVFHDVPDSHWAAEFINKLAESGIVSGRGESGFDPDSNITRAEYLKLLVESLGLSIDDAKAEFSDVAEDDWYYKYVAIAYSLGIANGTGDGKFSPNSPILRRDMAVLAINALKALGIELKAESDVELKDIELVAEYAKEAVKLLSACGIISGNENGEFMPDNLANRAQSAKIIYMLIQQCGKGSE